MVTCWMLAESTTSSGVMDLGYMTEHQDPTTLTLIETVPPMNNNITYYDFFWSIVTDTN